MKNREPAEHTKKASNWRSSILTGMFLLVLVSPLLLLMRKRPAAIPEADDGFRPIAQFTGEEHDVPHVKLKLPPTPALPVAPVAATAPAKPAGPARPTAPALASVIALPRPPATETAAPREAPAPQRPRKAERKAVAAKPTRPEHRLIAKLDKTAQKAAAPAVPREQTTAPEDDLWALPSRPRTPSAPKPAKPAPTPRAVEETKTASHVHGRRALPPPELPDDAQQQAQPQKQAVIIEHVSNPTP